LSTRNFVCQKLAAVCQKIAIFYSTLFDLRRHFYQRKKA